MFMLIMLKIAHFTMFLFLMVAVTLKASKMYSGSLSWPQLFPHCTKHTKKNTSNNLSKTFFPFFRSKVHMPLCACVCISLPFVCTYVCGCACVCVSMLVEARGSHWCHLWMLSVVSWNMILL